MNRADRVVDGRSGVQRWVADCAPLASVPKRSSILSSTRGCRRRRKPRLHAAALQGGSQRRVTSRADAQPRSASRPADAVLGRSPPCAPRSNARGSCRTCPCSPRPGSPQSAAPSISAHRGVQSRPIEEPRKEGCWDDAHFVGAWTPVTQRRPNNRHASGSAKSREG